jgi:hypothetical protein
MGIYPNGNIGIAGPKNKGVKADAITMIFPP